MKANALCLKCGTKWYLRPGEREVHCDRKIGKKKCGGRVVRRFKDTSGKDVSRTS